MKAIIQRVLSASVTVDKQVVSSISKGLLVFAAVAPDDDVKDAETLASKVVKMKCWDDDQGGKWKQNVTDISGEILCVSQFTLLANTRKGSKPDFHGAMDPKTAKELYDLFVRKVGEEYEASKVKDGVFQAMMEVALVNDGPVTFELNTPTKPDLSVSASASKPKPVKVKKLAKQIPTSSGNQTPLSSTTDDVQDVNQS